MKLWSWVIGGALLVSVAGCSKPTPPPRERQLHDRLRDFQTEVLDRRDQGRHDEAVATLLSMAAAAPGHPWAFELAARIHASPPRYAEAEALMRSMDPEGPALDYGLAHLLNYQRDREGALARLQVALERYQAAADPVGQAFCHKAIGLCLIYMRRYEEAGPALAVALELFEQIGDETWQAQVLDLIARVVRRDGRFDEALELQREARSIQRRIGDRRGEARNWYSAGFTERLAGRHASALEAFQTAAGIQREVSDRRAEYQSVEEQVRTYRDLDRDPSAIDALHEMTRIAEELGHAEWMFKSRRRASQLLSMSGRHREAIELLREARQDVLESGEDRLAASAEQILGEILAASGEYTAAADHLRTAVELARETALGSIEASAADQLSKVLLTTGRLADALVAAQRSLDLYRDQRNEDAVSYALIGIGEIHRQFGDLDSARRFFEDALAVARARARRLPENRRARSREATAQSALGVVLKDLGQLDQALVYQRASLELWESLGETLWMARDRSNLAELLWKMGRHDEAQSLVDQAIAEFREAGDRSREADALNLLGRLFLDSGRVEACREAGMTVVELAREHRLLREERNAHVLLAELHERTGRPDDALAEYRQAIEVIESERSVLLTDRFKTQLFASAAEIYERATVLQARLEAPGDPSAPAAFLLAERARARSLADLLAESAASLRSHLDPALAARELELIDRVSAAAVVLSEAKDRAGVAAASKDLARAGAALDRFKVELRRQAPEYSQIAYPDSVDLATIRRRVLAPDETLLRYFIGGGRALLWVVDAREARMVELGDPEGIVELVERLAVRLAQAGGGLSGRSEGDPLAEELARALALPTVASGRRLLVVPDGALHRVPFEVLRRDGRYLIEEHEVVVVPSATVLQRLRQAPQVAAGGFLGVGSPVEPAGSSFPRLVDSGPALGRIAGHFPDRVVLDGAGCTKQAIRDQSLDAFRFVHFATHGWLDPADPRRVGLRLSPAADGETADFLYPDDVFPLRLSAELVVLAACQSGLGELLPGEGVEGLTRAFLYAGARSVLVSLWNVSDRSTAEFMETFYRELDGRTIPQALRRAKLSFIRSDRPALRQPYHWAPFVLVGIPGAEVLRLNPADTHTNGREGREG